MDVNTMRFEQAVASLAPKLRERLREIPQSAKSTAFEVRLRVGSPLSICCGGQTWFVDNQSRLHNKPMRAVIVDQEEISESVISMCSYSVHSHQEEMKSGFISLIGGHRAGICGTAVTSNGIITSVRDITSVNLRIARDLEGVADGLIQAVFSNGPCGLLVAGTPSSGKTTVLRDLARQLGGGGLGRFVKVAVIDERCEIGAVYDGIPQNNLGACCDLLSGYPKGEGIQIALRTLSPQVILCDEIGSSAEVKGMMEGFNCGVKMVASVHAAAPEELLKRPQIRALLEAGAFEKIAMLSGEEHPGVVTRTMETRELFADYGDIFRSNMFLDDWELDGVKTIKTGVSN